MTSSSPLVSVIVNCFNGEKFLRDALYSVLAQDYQNWEVIFWDNLSTDRSRAILDSYGDDRFRYFQAQSHTVLYAARNQALAQTSGEFICLLDVDDWWTPKHLTLQLRQMEDPDVGVVCGNYWSVNEITGSRKIRYKSPRPSGYVVDELLKAYFVALPTLMIRRDALEGLDCQFDERFHVIGDFDLVTRLAVSWKVSFIPTPIAYYRIHGENESRLKRDLQIDELQLWQNSPFIKTHISKRPNYRYIQEFILYKEGINSALKGERRNVLKCIANLPWSIKRLVLVLTNLVPSFVLKKIASFI